MQSELIERVKLEMRRRRISIRELGRRIDMHPLTISKFLDGRTVTRGTVRRICTSLRIKYPGSPPADESAG